MKIANQNIPELLQERDNLLEDLDKNMELLRTYGHDKAEAKSEYHREYAFALGRLRDGNVPMTIIKEMAKGEIWESEKSRDTAEIAWNYVVENLQVLKKKLQSVENEIESVRRGL